MAQKFEYLGKVTYDVLSEAIEVERIRSAEAIVRGDPGQSFCSRVLAEAAAEFLLVHFRTGKEMLERAEQSRKTEEKLISEKSK